MLSELIAERAMRLKCVLLGLALCLTSVASAQPTAPSALAVTALSSVEARLSWVDNSPDETAFLVEHCDGAGCSSRFVQVDSIGADITALTKVGLAAGSAHGYRVRAVGAGGYSAYSNIVWVTMPPPPPPSAPSSLLAVAQSSSAVGLSWTLTSADATSVVIDRCSGTACSTFNAVATISGNATSYQNVGLAGNTSYSFRLRATNSGGASQNSNVATATTMAVLPPATPSGLVATAISASAISLRWVDGSTVETSVLLEWCAGVGCTSFAQAAALGANVTTWQHSGLTPGGSYSYRVAAANASGASAFSPVATAITPAPPAAPTQVSAVGTSSSITVAWADVGNETSYDVESCSGAGCTTFRFVASLAANDTTYTEAAIPGTPMRFRVRAANGAGYSVYSTVVTASATATAPTAPTGLSVRQSSSTSVALTWTDNSSDETAFLVERCAGAGCSAFAGVASANANSSTFTDAALQTGTALSYRVSAINSAGASGFSNVASISIPLVPIPAAPTGLTSATASSTEIQLSWVDNSSDEVGFLVERCEGQGCSSFSQVDSLAPNRAADLRAGLGAGRTYSFRVRATGIGGRSAYSNVATSTTLAPVIPAAPVGLAITSRTATTLLLTWQDQATNETFFMVDVCAGTGCTSFQVVAQTRADSTAVAVGPLAAGTSYSFRVRAATASGISGYSNVVTTVAGTANPPTSLVATAASATSATLRWHDASNDETGFEIERCSGSGCSPVRYITKGPNTVEHTDVGLLANTPYSYRIRAANQYGSSDASNSATLQTPIGPVPAAPTGLSRGSVTATSVALTWIDASNDEQNFSVERCMGAGCTSFAPIISLAANTSSYVNTGLASATSYVYRVRASNSSGSSAYTDPVAVATLTLVPPLAPSGLIGTITSPLAIQLTWINNASNATQNILEWCLGLNCATFTTLASLSPVAAAFTHTAVAMNSSYRYRVRSVNADGATLSNVASVTIAVPAAPSQLTAGAVPGTNSPHTIVLTWTAPATGETSFAVDRCMVLGCTSPTLWRTVPATTRGATDTLSAPLASGYRYQVRSVNALGTSAPSAPVSVGPLLPSTRTGLTVSPVSASELSLRWNDVDTLETAVTVERCLGAGCSAFATRAVVGANITSFADTGLAPSTTAQYRVRAVNAFGSAPNSPVAAAVTSALPPAAPGSVVVTALSSSILSVTWQDVTPDEASFTIERCLGNNCTNFQFLASVGANVLMHHDSSLTEGTAYRYRLKAINSGGASPYSTTVAASTLPPAPPAAPTALAVSTLSSNALRLTWSDQSSNETEFRVQRCRGAGCVDFVPVGSVNANAVTFIDSLLANSTSYSYRLSATGAGGTSPFTGIASATTLPPAPPAPLNVRATSPVPGRVALAWNDNSSLEAGFSIWRCTGQTCTNFLQVASTGANVTSLQESGLTSRTVYRYQIRAVGAGGISAPSSTVNVTTR